MEKKNILTAMLLVLALISVSCNDWLDVQQDTEKKADEMFDDYSGFKGALAGCYADLSGADLYGTRLTMSDVECLAGLWYIDPSRDLSETLLADNALTNHAYSNTYALDAIKSIYGAFYNVILESNLILEGCREKSNHIPDARIRALVEGEAYAIRALCQFDVLRLFGQLPTGATQQVSLPYSFTTSLEEVPAYYSYDEYLALLENDIEQALVLMKDNDPLFEYTYQELNTLSGTGAGDLSITDDFVTNRHLRMNYWAVKALQARFYLYTGQKELAYAAAMEVIDAKTANGSPIIQLSSMEDYGGDGVKYTSESECLFGLWIEDLYSLSAPLLAGGNATGSNAMNVDLSNNLVLTTTWYNDLFAGTNPATDIRYAKMWSQTRGVSSTTVYPSIRKYYVDNLADDVNVEGVVPVLRLSEVYLIAVETAPTLAAANSLYEEYMLSKGVALHEPFAAPETIVPELEQEYRREFFAEGQVFYFYKRHQITQMWSKPSVEITESDYILPLPNTEFNPNEN